MYLFILNGKLEAWDFFALAWNEITYIDSGFLDFFGYWIEFLQTDVSDPKLTWSIKSPTWPYLDCSIRVQSGYPFGSGTLFTTLVYIRRGHFEIFGLDFTENETAVLNVFQDLKSEISEKSDQNWGCSMLKTNWSSRAQPIGQFWRLPSQAGQSWSSLSFGPIFLKFWI